MQILSDGGAVVEAVNQDGGRSPVLRCDDESEARIRALQLNDAAGRIQQRINGARTSSVPAGFPGRRPRRTEYPRIPVAFPPDVLDRLRAESERQQIGLSALIVRFVLRGLPTWFAGALVTLASLTLAAGIGLNSAIPRHRHRSGETAATILFEIATDWPVLDETEEPYD